MTTAPTIIIMFSGISGSSNAAPGVIICVKEIDSMDEQECPDIYKKIYEKRKDRAECTVTLPASERGICRWRMLCKKVD